MISFIGVGLCVEYQRTNALCLGVGLCVEYQRTNALCLGVGLCVEFQRANALCLGVGLCVSINGQEVFEMSHNQIVSLIKNSGTNLALVVER